MNVNLRDRLKNVFGDREITGEIFLKPCKWCFRHAHKTFDPNSTALKVAKFVIGFIFSPLILLGMALKCLNVGQVKAYNEKVRQKLQNRETLDDYPDQPETVVRYSRTGLLAILDNGDKNWDRMACNIYRYRGQDEVLVQFMARFPRWQIPNLATRPYDHGV